MNELLPQPEHDHFRAKAAASEHPRELIIDLLRAIQEHHGWVPDEGVELTAEILGLSPLQVEEIATFYDKIFRRPVGRKVIHYCDSICCWATGGEQVAAHLQQKLGIGPGETTADGAFTLLPSCCLGACGDAPAMMIELKLYGRLTPEKIDAALEKEKD
ncbi:NADH-quinone oxidoreductase subunit NuoE [Geothermobacter hydrogeniphilus]|uniref:NADH-quinone oxidoreductase subunit NuoE n=1 Tax=Geothermobacter hydrogeniphilus TaxID=1969733 RepID=A0A2K2HEN5_9BACT|nr:NADH-quinone oxidoreductase subunit NuoE [Geothermobacter hydrogeniphilus]PNU21740.1 NADH-quinone oxidoreductase subunit NuoE [Geothermobacter hydrogeniphilus]